MIPVFGNKIPVDRNVRQRRKWPFVLVGLVLAATIIAGIGFAAYRSRQPVDATSGRIVTKPTAAEQDNNSKTQPIRLIASGDELPHTALTQAAKTSSGYDYTPFYKTIKPVYQAADLRFCNQETVTAGEQYGISGYPAFNVSKQFAHNLSDTGCNLISLANNHMNDKGQAGIDETLSVWDQIKPYAFAGVNRSPEEQNKVRYFEYRGVKFAFVSYTAISNTQGFAPFALNMLDDGLVTRQLTDARRQADIVLVSVHWGTEYSDGIDSEQDKWAAKFTSLNADVVLGTGPHVLEPVKYLPRADGKKTLVWYSLGNMLSAQIDTPSLIGGFGVMDIDPATKELSLVGMLPTYMHYEWTADQKASEDLLSRHGFQIYPLDQAAEPLARSQNNTTVAAQTDRVRKLLNSYTTVPILSYDEYLAR